MSSFSLPHQVARFDGAIDTMGDACRPFGRRAWVVGGPTALTVVGGRIAASFARSGIEIAGTDEVTGHCSVLVLAPLLAKAPAVAADLIIAVGGGRAIDSGKALAERLRLPVATVPTIAATCAAFSTVSISYTDDGHFLSIDRLRSAPVVVVIDSAVIAKAPARWLAAGFGDTLAKWYEIRAIAGGRTPDAGGMAAASSGRLCYDLIARYGAEACAALADGKANTALEAVLDAIIVHAGMTSIMGVGAHSAAAHAVFEGFTVLDQTRALGHGFLVGYGNLVLLALEGRDDAEIRAEIALAKACGIPTRLADLAPLSADDLRTVAEAACPTEDMSNMPFPIGPDDVLKAMARIETL